ncbi:hypothetical protein [Derxia gummosa]|uniref:Lipid A biosynthesis lauroyl acyltransferase n=1 Tax=Derxia gummosa DSM 723 TaxID=1121388 RepID=A0A8B6XBL3_9BURK|nr:hypothetical protein [Derxia gummosa]
MTDSNKRGASALARAGAHAAVGFIAALRFVPHPLLRALGNGLGALLWRVAGSRRRIVLRNLELCFPELDAAARERLGRAHVRMLARSLLDRSFAFSASAERLRQLVKIEHRERLPDDRPVILLSPHFVGLDAGAAVLSIDRDWCSVMSTQSNPVFDKAVRDGRLRFGHGLLLSRQEGLRAIVRAIRDLRAFYYLPDMDFGPRDSVFVPFMGVPAATITGLARLAQMTRAAVVPCVTRMTDDGYVVTLYPEWENFPGDLPPDDPAHARRMNAFIEERIREMPEQYYWVHRRFKTRPPGEPSLY